MLTSDQMLSKHHDILGLLRNGLPYKAVIRMTGKSLSTVIKVAAAIREAPLPLAPRSPLLVIADILSGRYWGEVLENLTAELVGDAEIWTPISKSDRSTGERTRAGLASARARGTRLGRPTGSRLTLPVDDCRAALAGGMSLRAFAAARGVSASSLRRAMADGMALDPTQA